MAPNENLSQRRFALNNGSGEIPALGFGTSLSDRAQTRNAVKAAVKVGFRHLDAANLKRKRLCDLRAIDCFPVGQHCVVVRIAVDVVVISRADRGGQMRLAIEQDEERRSAIGKRNGRQGLRAEFLRSRGIDIFRIVQGLHQQPWRNALEFA